MKRLCRGPGFPLPRVTPHTGVWIETPLPFDNTLPSCVTPHTGVWIETFSGSIHMSVFIVSPPIRGCGLKQDQDRRVLDLFVASPPIRGCGLKLTSVFILQRSDTSPPIRGCGLKPYLVSIVPLRIYVTPHTGVWIETSPFFETLS